ncbi:MAG: hypothetical protein L3J65_02810 [Robiginitomaculum sp.]|nr:hypothetical protein [Robiginitomaculum sp.]
MKKLLAATLLVASTAAISLPAIASDDSLGKNSSNILNLFHGAPKIKDADGNYWKLRGRLFWDGAAISETPINGVENNFDDSEFRAVRIGIEGKYGKFKFKTEVDYEGGETTVKDLFFTWAGPLDISVGQMKAGLTLEELNSARHYTFIERGMITDAIGYDRRIGVNAGKSGENYSLNAGVFGNSVDGAVDGAPTNTIWAARGTYAPVLKKGRVVHIGASMRHTNRALGAPKHSARWGPHLAREKIKPIIGGDALLYGLEAATVIGAFHGHIEFIKEDGNLGSVEGGFIQAGYFLTGEIRNYKAKSGQFSRTKPLNPLSKGSFGGWEVAARFDRLDARNAGDEKVDAWTVGLTWYPESHLRLRLNYTDASGDLFSAKGLYTRLQIDW